MTAPAPYIFVSYASPDRERVLQVVAAMQSAGIGVWLDQDAIEGGTNWGREIAEAIQGCAAFVLMSSAASLSSRNVRQEIALAWKHGKPYLPLLLDTTLIPTDIEYWLETAQWVEVLDQPAADWLPRVQRALERLGTVRVGPGEAEVPSRDPTPAPEAFTADHRPRPRVRHRVKPFLVGREREQEQLNGWLSDSLAGRGGVVLVGGEAGIGKTTLTTWLLWAAEERGALVRVGGCYDLTTTPPYGPWVEITRGWPEESGLPQLPHALREGVGLESVHSQAALFELVARFLSDTSAARPLVLLLEDLHWADQASLDLLRYLSRAVGDWPLLLAVTYRDDELTRRHPLFALLPSLAREPHAHRLTLTRLDSDAVGELVTSRYGLPSPDVEKLVAYVQRLTEGNPFFAGEVLRALEEAGALHRDGDTWRLLRLEQIHVPALVRQVIESRLSRLGEDARRLLEVAAVIGHEVEIDLWVAVSGADEVLLADMLDRATEARLVEETANRTRFRFTHALVRETLYEGLVSLRVRAWHRQVADALIAGADPSADAVAHHLQQAGDLRAFDWLVQAGDSARAAYAWFDAIDRYEHAVALIHTDPARVQERGWLLYRIAALQRPEMPRTAVAYSDAARDAAVEAGDRTLDAYATFMHGLTQCMIGEYDLGLPELRAGVAAVDRLTVADLERSGRLLTTPFADETAMARDNLAAYLTVNLTRGIEVLYLAVTGHYRDAIEIGEAFVAETTQQPLVLAALHTQCDAYFGLAIAYAMLGQPDRARASFDQAIDGAASFGYYFLVWAATWGRWRLVHWPYAPDDPLERAYLQRVATQAEQRLSGVMRSVQDRSAAQAIEDTLEDRWDGLIQYWSSAPTEDNRLLAKLAPSQIGEIARRRGQRDAAWSALADFVLDDRDDAALIGSLFADVPTIRLGIVLHLDAADRDGALPWLQAHDRFLRRSQAVLGRAEGALLWARYHRVAGDLAQARAAAERAVAHATAPRQPVALLRAHRFSGELLTEMGELDAADEHLRSSLDIAEAIDIRSEMAWTQLALAELRAACGEAEAARSLLESVRAVFEPLDARPTLARAAALGERVASVAVD